MEESYKNKVLDLIRQTLRYREEPAIICSRSRVSCETILSFIWMKEYNVYPDKIMYQALMDGISTKSPGLIPTAIKTLFGTIQHFGNYTSHAQNDLAEFNETHASMVETALTGVANWFFGDYLQSIPIPDLNVQNTAQAAQEVNYKQLLYSILEDNVIEVEEFEQLNDVRDTLQLSTDIYNRIEAEVLYEKLGTRNYKLIELLKPEDLESVKRKHEKNDQRFAKWVEQAKIDLESSNEVSLEYKNLLSYYIDKNVSEINYIPDNIIGLLGCWQGWYSQSNMKTFFDLIFIAVSNDVFIGITVEPINSNWLTKIESKSGVVNAMIKGQIHEGDIFSFSKEYLVEKPWTINYNGVIVDQGKYFEGEWDVKNLSGSFNAIKTKSLLPIHIYNTTSNLPITRFKYLDKFNVVNGTWFLRINGKKTEYSLLHLFQNGKEVFGNLVFEKNNMISYYFMFGSYQSSDRVFLEVSLEDEQSEKVSMSFSIDWGSREINGKISTALFPFRSIKGNLI